MQESSARELFLWLIRRRLRYRVTGASMLPLLKEGDEVLVDRRGYQGKTPSIGDIVIARHPLQSDLQIIKRIEAVYEDGSYQLAGDNPDPSQNSPSRVTAQLILGRVTSCFSSAG